MKMTQKQKDMKRITKSTVKSFIRKNYKNLFINVRSSFDSMTDGCQWRNTGFRKIQPDENCIDYTLGIKGAWFVGSSRDYFTAYSENGFTGYQVSNSCGLFILAVQE
jgi:hypothetical protein